jgi:hypothetical protein
MRALIATTIASLAVLGCVGTPHRDVSEISDAEVAVYKSGMEMGCRDAGRSRGDPISQVDSFCACLMSTLNARLSQDEWKKATFSAQQRKDREEAQVLAPYMAAVGECRKHK